MRPRLSHVLGFLFRQGGIGVAMPALAPILFGLSGCGPDNSERGGESSLPSGFSQWDSAGVAISVTQSPGARAPIGWEVDSVPDLVLGAGSDPDRQFFRIGGLRALSNGGVLVVDGGSRELRFFDSEGHRTNRVGRKGEGPGEFDRPMLVHTVGTDSLLLWDAQLRRFQLFSIDGQDHRTISLKNRWPGGGRPPVGAIGPWMLVEVREAMKRAERRKSGTLEQEVGYVWLEPATGVELSIASFSTISGYSTVKPGRPPEISLIPFSSWPAATVTTGAALITEGRRSEVREYDLKGALQRIFRVPEAGRPVTKEMIEGALDLETAANVASREFWA